MPLLDKFQQHDYKIDFERIELVCYNKVHIKFFHCVTFKYNRTTAVVNWTNEYNVNIGYDLELLIQVYKFASNKYRTFSIRLKLNFCEAVRKNVTGYGELSKWGTFTPCPIVKEKKSSQSSLKKKLSGQLRRSKDSVKSLSTIPEEPKSLQTISSKTISSNEQPEDDGKAKRVPLPPPPLPEPLPPREKRHTSVLLKGSSKATVVAHDRPRTLSMQERLLSHLTLAGRPLFPTVVGQQEKSTRASILVTGFGLRNLSSLQEALQAEEHNKLKQLYRAQDRQDQSSSSAITETTESTASLHFSHQKTESSSTTQTDETPATWQCAHKKKLLYLMGLHGFEEEEASKAELQEVHVQEVPEEPGGTEAMRQAQKYLRIHQIFEFFQFIIAHLLSALPENPIEFIIDLLDKCLVYRSGLAEPPLLYNRKHLECLFYLMDKMRTGYIELEQYKTGMRTVGVCKFNQKPRVTPDGTVTKDQFIEEAYDCLSHLLNDMLKRRWLRSPPPVTPVPPPTPQVSTARTSTYSGEYPDSPTRFTKTRLFLDCI